MGKFSRREILAAASATPFLTGRSVPRPPAYAGGLTDIDGLKVGHFTDTRRPTGCTVVLAEGGAVAGVDVRGSAPGTRETDLLDPSRTVQKVHAIILSGGSAFGLDTASGVMSYLEGKGIGYQTSVAKVPIVPAAILFDLGVGDPSIRPDSAAGFKACQNASSGKIVEGNVGAGAGATVGKLLGPDHSMKGGLGSASIRIDSLIVAALAAVNCIGDVLDPADGAVLAGVRRPDGTGFAGSMDLVRARLAERLGREGENTTLAVVATNAAFEKPSMKKIAEMAHDGYARAINPVHLPFDGDTIFSLSTGTLTGVDLGSVGALAAEVVSLAIARAVLTAESLPGIPSCRDWPKK